MNQFSALIPIMGMATAGMLVTACTNERDATKEIPVDPLPGLYDVSLSGAGLLKAGGREGPHEFCVTEANRFTFSHTLVKKFYQFHYSCVGKPSPRLGNAIAGEISCAADPKLAQGANRFVYQGTVSEDAVDITVQMKLDAVIREDEMTEEQVRQLKLGMKAMEMMTFIIEAKHTGAC